MIENPESKFEPYKMPKDLKIGLAVGLGFVIAAVLWLATRPSLLPEARIQRLDNTDAQKPTDVKSNILADSRNPTRELAPDRKSIEDQANKPENHPAPAPQGPPEAPIEAAPPPMTEAEPEPVRQEQPEPIKTERFYIVRKNDTLSSISQKYYGTATKWPKLFEANRESVPNANRLAIGTKLIVPD